jgi:hypothetical protein
MSTRSITHPPKVEPQTIYARFENVEVATLLVGIHAALVQLNEAAWVDDDDYEQLLVLWAQWTGVPFRDTLPTYTIEINGKPLTGEMQMESLRKVQAVRPPEVCETILNAEAINLPGMEPEEL